MDENQKLTHLGKFFEWVLQKTYNPQTGLNPVRGSRYPEIASTILDTFNAKLVLCSSLVRPMF